MKDQITRISLDVLLGLRLGVGNARMVEYGDYIKNLIEAKEAGLDVNLLPMPLLSDRVAIGMEAGLSARSEGGVNGGVTWQIVELGGSFSREQQQGIKIKTDMEFMSVGAPDLGKMQALSVEELKKLLEVVETNS